MPEKLSRKASLRKKLSSNSFTNLFKMNKKRKRDEVTDTSSTSNSGDISKIPGTDSSIATTSTSTSTSTSTTTSANTASSKKSSNSNSSNVSTPARKRRRSNNGTVSTTSESTASTNTNDTTESVDEEWLKREKELDANTPLDLKKYRPKGFSINLPPTDRPVRIYADGVFDLFHLGHMRQLEQCKKAFPNVSLICGIPNDKITHKLKGLTVLSDKQRCETLRHCRWVDEVIPDSPWCVTPEFLEKHKIDYVAHDDLPYVSANSDDIYKPIKEMGKFLSTQRTEGVSTSDIITKIIRDYDKYLMRNFARGATRQELNVSWLKKNELEFKKHISDFRSYFKKNQTQLNNASKDLYFEVRELLLKKTLGNNLYSKLSSDPTTNLKNLKNLRNIIRKNKNKKNIQNNKNSNEDDDDDDDDEDDNLLLKNTSPALDFVKEFAAHSGPSPSMIKKRKNKKLLSSSSSNTSSSSSSSSSNNDSESDNTNDNNNNSPTEDSSDDEAYKTDGAERDAHKNNDDVNNDDDDDMDQMSSDEEINKKRVTDVESVSD
ncbi:hypothetical protein TBLA_0B07640 [Henningerozyma blattae CBS 6284]|uniref:choline-phosphate cytidylyltransferase n=1 Tax=Henningerozyma blattae (strain ATCC 34711 / CBS 6284 / DSM 70876 / NBRC 10599 / NRRL Y-10934 / UCD 77-7) TaxID=1071380 RepID=I2GZM8_HENB6|nr:hypothetical protein TBLA_0B07640 [Tetrapisispora blattae CBS 6284]CCH59580.1 hypothetical protein TBLA_0B07640 [Tetrapisispora blattae CBS 6284]